MTRKGKNSSKSARSAIDEIKPVPTNTGRPKNPVWEHYHQGKETSAGHWQATCKYCNAQWGKGVIYEMENLEEKDKEPELGKKRKSNSGIQRKITSSFKKTQMDDPVQEKNITRALVKAFALCGIPWHIIENPFFIDALKQLNPAYDPPSREVFVNRHFETELTKINKKIHDELQHENNLTLVLDGWSSAKNRSLWNFIILTPECKEYMYCLSNFTDYSHTGDFLAGKIEDILNKVGPEKFSAICSNNASNVKLARSIIVKKYPNIIDMRCISHCFNLITCNIMGYSFASKLIAKVNAITKFFKTSHLAGAKLNEMIKERNIEGGGLKTYCKTRWTTVYDSVASVLRLKLILEYINEQHSDLLTNKKIGQIISGRNFFGNLKVLCNILHPIKKAILTLEAQTTTLADCYSVRQMT
ncbi:unnamed protein product [Rhizophagus irregularis]|nr:unnamed protein product [Rhizophagus irregularis]